MKRDDVIQFINSFFISVDTHQWEKVENSLTDTVLLDYKSMNGKEPSVEKRKDIVESWKNFLPGFDSTHHQLGNYLISSTGERIQIFLYVTASHYLKNETEDNLWQVVGSYNIEIIADENTFKISEFRFNFKFSTGNEKLTELAGDRIKSN